MTPPEPPQVQDVTAWRLGKIEESLGAVLVKLDDRPDWKDVRNIEAQLAGRLTKLEDWQTWAIRIVVGLVLTGIVGLVISGGRVL